MHYSIDDYLKFYKDFTFDEEPFNDVDNVLLSLISYVNLDKVFKNNDKLTMEEVSKRFWNNTTEKEVNNEITSVRKSSYLIKKLANCKRFKDLSMYNFKYQVDKNTQFGAVTIDLLNGTIYISYRGTDSYVIGWKEDFEMSYIFPVEAQKLAIKYINENVKFSNKKVIVGGHSKGGNLALVASMYAKHNIKKKIVKVYSNDGLGLRDEEFNSQEYKKIVPKFKHIIPRESLVGVLYSHDNNYVVIDSSGRGFFQHDATTWKCYGSHFIKADLTLATKKREDSLYKWLKKYDDSEKKHIVESMYSVFNKLGIDDLKELKMAKFPQILKLIINLRNIDEETKKILFKTFKELHSQFKDNKFNN